MKFVGGLKNECSNVKHETSTVKYTFLVPEDKTLKASDLVKVSTKRGNALVTFLCDSFVVDTTDKEKMETIFNPFGTDKPTAYVIGKFTYDEWK